jgi:oxygen-independent coproporphyrinogen-3 oxidase
VKPNAGLYVHIPYCVRRCSYCTFVLTTDFSTRDRYLAALHREANFVGPETERTVFDSLYFGGGTPSAISAASLAVLLDAFRRAFAFTVDAEVTIEANPDDVTPETVAEWGAAGATRISLGVQSFRDDELRAIDRIHSSSQAQQALDRLLGSGFSVSCDLMIGIPGQKREGFLADVDRLAASPIGHLSIYVLELDKAKPMAEDRKRHPERYLTDDELAEAYLEASRRLADAGFRHYEVSNWCRPGQEARHNTKYWNRTSTIGLGVGAHELWGGRRRANTSSLGKYLDALENGRRPTTIDQPVEGIEREREEIILSARTSEGIPAARIDGWLRERADVALQEDWRAWEKEGLIDRREDRYVLTERGFLLSSEILCRFV